QVRLRDLHEVEPVDEEVAELPDFERWSVFSTFELLRVLQADERPQHSVGVALGALQLRGELAHPERPLDSAHVLKSAQHFRRSLIQRIPCARFVLGPVSLPRSRLDNRPVLGTPPTAYTAFGMRPSMLANGSCAPKRLRMALHRYIDAWHTHA